jgi:hypothetical protein
VKASTDLVIAPGLSVSLAGGGIKEEVKDLGCLGVVAKIWDELDLSALLDSSIAVEEELQLSSGLALKAMVLNIIGDRAANRH